MKDMSAGTRWTGWSAATSGSARPRSRCARAFVAVADGKQVAVLCPTTLLAEQHFQTFRDRFADWPVQHRRAVALSLAEGGRAGRRRDSTPARSTS